MEVNLVNGSCHNGTTIKEDSVPAEDIKTMKLYLHVDRIFSELKELGYGEIDNLKVEDVCRFDQYHYHGTKSVDDMAKLLQIGPSHRVLDIGAGLGGPARFLASTTGCHVTAVELQQDLVDAGTLLNKRCGLNDKVQMVCGDFLELNDFQDYDLVISWLTFLHIPNKAALFKKCHDVLKPGGEMFIEDYCREGDMTAKESECLEKEVYCQDPPTISDYRAQLEKAGFSCKIEDITDSWRVFVKNRLMSHRADRERFERVHNQQVFEEQDHFFTAINSLFENPSGHLRGCKVIART